MLLNSKIANAFKSVLTRNLSRTPATTGTGIIRFAGPLELFEMSHANDDTSHNFNCGFTQPDPSYVVSIIELGKEKEKKAGLLVWFQCGRSSGSKLLNPYFKTWREFFFLTGAF